MGCLRAGLDHVEEDQFLALTRTQPRLHRQGCLQLHQPTSVRRPRSWGSVQTPFVPGDPSDLGVHDHAWLIKLGCASTSEPSSRTAVTPNRRRRYSSSAGPRRGKSVPRKETPARAASSGVDASATRLSEAGGGGVAVRGIHFPQVSTHRVWAAFRGASARDVWSQRI